MRRCLVFTISLVVGFIGLSRALQHKKDDALNKVSPNGTYRVKIVFSEESSTERLKISFFKREQLIRSDEWVKSDPYEPSLQSWLAAVDWLADNILRVGRVRSDQPYDDHLIVLNNTDEELKYVEVDYGRSQAFHVFDLAPKTKVVLYASPEFKPDGSSNYYLGYGGKSQSGKDFEGTQEQKQRASPADGRLTLQIVVNPIDLR